MQAPNHIAQELNELASSLPYPAAPTAGYQVPAGYFENLAAQVLQRIKAIESADAAEEMAHLSPLLSSIDKKTPYKVPAGYFEQLQGLPKEDTGSAAEELAELSPLLSSLDKKLPYNTPTGYFDQLAGIALANTQTPAEELTELSPLLASIGKKIPYKVPAGYFEQLQPNNVSANSNSTARVISFNTRKLFRYAAAAVITGFIAVSVVFWFNQKQTDPSVEQPYAWVKKNMNKVSTEDIDEIVTLADATKDLAQVNTGNDIKNLLKDVSDKEIQDFLNETQADEIDATDDDLLLN